jgi:hypothetical protein
MTDLREVVDTALSGAELAARYRAMCDDPLLARVPGKIELDVWGRLCSVLGDLGGEVVYGRQGLMQRSAYPVELANLFA